MNTAVIVDTDILIDASREDGNAISCLQQIELKASLAISAVTLMELMVGCRNKAELRALEQFMLRFQILKLNEQITDVSTDLLRRYRLSHGLLIADAMIAATAIASGWPLVSKNQRDYRYIAELTLLPYPSPLAAAQASFEESV